MIILFAGRPIACEMGVFSNKFWLLTGNPIVCEIMGALKVLTVRVFFAGSPIGCVLKDFMVNLLHRL